MTERSIQNRQLVDKSVKVIAATGAVFGLLVLTFILFEVLRRGIGALNLELVFGGYRPFGMKGGGVRAAILGTSIMTGLATLVGIPLGMLTGVYLAEYARGSRFAEFVRFTTNILIGTPSIIIGIFIYGVIVIWLSDRSYSGYAGAIALSVMMIPLVARTTEEILLLVPDRLRESALALGTPRWKTTVDIVFRNAQAGLITGGLLAVARISGETAPLLFTAVNNDRFLGLNQPTPNLTVTIFNYAMSGDQIGFIPKAWGASFLITVAVLALTITARTLFGRKH